VNSPELTCQTHNSGYEIGIIYKNKNKEKNDAYFKKKRYEPVTWAI